MGSRPDSKKDRQAEGGMVEGREGGRPGQVESTSILWSGSDPLVAAGARREEGGEARAGTWHMHAGPASDKKAFSGA